MQQRHTVVSTSSRPPAIHGWLPSSPQTPGNLGTILRTIDAVGASGLVLLDGGVDPYHPSAIRAGMGPHSVFRWRRPRGSVRGSGRTPVAIISMAHRPTAARTTAMPASIPRRSSCCWAANAKDCRPSRWPFATICCARRMHGHVRSLNLAVAPASSLCHPRQSGRTSRD